MEFINRHQEMQRLRRVVDREQAALVVIWGRRRLGKSRLLAEWCQQVSGTYWVADESAPAIQRQYLAEALETLFPGFAAVTYPDWTTLLTRLSDEAKRLKWPGPFVIDEFPYLISGSPELPSVLQKWVDREKREGGITLALSGSSQRMMLDSVLNSDAPLFGRADEMFRLEPLMPGHICQSMGMDDAQSALDFFTCWGGVPRYWELAQPFGKDYRSALDYLVLSPLGVLHDEIERLLRKEMPSAIPMRPILDAIGLGAHRSSEIAGRLQTPATSLTRSLKQLRELGYIRRDLPYGENEKRSKKALYRLADPFLRLWFKMVASHRGALQTSTTQSRLKLIEKNWANLRAESWEDLCRLAIPRLRLFDREWDPAKRYWAGNQSEWDVVSRSLEGDMMILGECKSLSRPAGQEDINKIVRELMAKPAPAALSSEGQLTEYVVFVPALEKGLNPQLTGITVIDGRRVFSALTED
jgi:AAA+ ATPase superfamily predicted ATPase